MTPTQRRRTTHLLASALFAGGLLQVLTGSAPRLGGADTAPPPAFAQSHKARAAHVAAPPQHRQFAAEAASILSAIAHRTSDASQAGALFAARSWYSPPPPPPPPPPAPVAAPTAPLLPYTFLGRYTDGNNATVYFLTREDRVYDVRPGDVIDQVYSVDAVENGQLVFTYKPLNVRQLLPIGESP